MGQTGDKAATRAAWMGAVSMIEANHVSVPEIMRHYNATTIILCCDECGSPLADEDGNMDVWQFRGGNYHQECKDKAVRLVKAGIRSSERGGDRV